MKYCVLGAGLMGKAAAYDLLHQHDTTSLMLVDSNKSKLIDAKDFLNSATVEIETPFSSIFFTMSVGLM